MNTADRSECEKFRDEIRKYSGVRVGCIWSVTLLILLIVYLISMAVLRYFNHRQWSESIDSALKQGDIARAEALLTACRRDLPALRSKADFAIWERQLEVLKNNQQQKLRRFELKLGKLRKQLEAEDADPQLLLMRLAEVARECSDESQLEDLRELQLRCEALARMRELVSAQSGAVEIASLQEQLVHAETLLKQHEYSRFFELLESCTGRARSLVQKYYNIRKIAEQGRVLQKKIRSLHTRGTAEQQQYLASEADFVKLLQAATAADLIAGGKDFLKKYPSSSHGHDIENLFRELTFLKNQTWHNGLARQLRQQQQRLQRARQLAIKLIKEFMAENYTMVTYELVLRLDDNRLMRWECYTPQSFSEADPQGVITIAFRDTADRKIKGEFTADGRGKVVVNGVVRQGKLEKRQPIGDLPQPYWQRKLKMFDGIETLPDFLPFLSTALPEAVNDRDLPEALRSQLQVILRKVQQEFNTTPQQYMFTEKVLTFCRQSQLRFGGIVLLADGRIAKLNWVIDRPQPSTVWILKAHRNKAGIGFYGSARSRTVTAEVPVKNFSNTAHILAVMENAADCRKQLLLWQQEARQNNLVMPQLPDFLQFK